MERAKFIKLIDSVYNGEEKISWKELSEVSLQFNFIDSLIKDRTKINSFFDKNVLGKKGGVSIDDLTFTVNILNKDETPALRKYVGYDNRWLVIYFGISPELENFVSIVLWPSESNSSRLSYEKILDTIKNEKSLLEFSGGHIILPNEIHPQRFKKINITKRDELFYDWKHFPFIKDTGESLSRPKSPTYFKKIFLRDESGCIYEDYIMFREIIGSIVDMRGDELKVKVPFLEERPYSYKFKIKKIDKVNIVKKLELYHFLLIERAGNKDLEVFDIEPASQIDALAHLISYKLYEKFISSTGQDKYRQYINIKNNPMIGELLNIDYSKVLEITSIKEYNKLVSIYANLIYNRIYPISQSDERLSLKIDLADYIFKTYLSPYFKNDNEKIYYVPQFHRYNTGGFLAEKFFKIKKSLYLNSNL